MKHLHGPPSASTICEKPAALIVGLATTAGTIAHTTSTFGGQRAALVA